MQVLGRASSLIRALTRFASSFPRRPPSASPSSSPPPSRSRPRSLLSKCPTLPPRAWQRSRPARQCRSCAESPVGQEKTINRLCIQLCEYGKLWSLAYMIYFGRTRTWKVIWILKRRESRNLRPTSCPISELCTKYALDKQGFNLLISADLGSY